MAFIKLLGVLFLAVLASFWNSWAILGIYDLQILKVTGITLSYGFVYASLAIFSILMTYSHRPVVEDNTQVAVTIVGKALAVGLVYFVVWLIS